MKRFLVILMLVGGCNTQPSGPTYDQALQTYSLETELLERAKKERADFLTQMDADIGELEGVATAYPTGHELSTRAKGLLGAAQKKRSERLTALDQQISTQEEKVRKQKAILDEAEKRR